MRRLISAILFCILFVSCGINERVRNNIQAELDGKYKELGLHVVGFRNIFVETGNKWDIPRFNVFLSKDELAEYPDFSVVWHSKRHAFEKNLYDVYAIHYGKYEFAKILSTSLASVGPNHTIFLKVLDGDNSGNWKAFVYFMHQIDKDNKADLDSIAEKCRIFRSKSGINDLGVETVFVDSCLMERVFLEDYAESEKNLMELTGHEYEVLYNKASKYKYNLSFDNSQDIYTWFGFTDRLSIEEPVLEKCNRLLSGQYPPEKFKTVCHFSYEGISITDFTASFSVVYFIKSEKDDKLVKKGEISGVYEVETEKIIIRKGL